MPSLKVEEFAKQLVQLVRDKAIEACDMNMRSDTIYPAAKRWKSTLGTSEETATSVIVPDCVDETIFNFLRAIDDGALRILFRAQDDTIVDLGQEGDGELAGWYVGSGGWRAMYSHERFIDDVSDLTGKS